MHQEIKDSLLELTESETTVYLFILATNWHLKKCTWPYQTIAARTCLHYHTISNSVSELTKKKLITKQTERFGKGGSKTILRIPHMNLWRNHGSTIPGIGRFFEEVKTAVTSKETKTPNLPEGRVIFTYSKYLLKEFFTWSNDQIKNSEVPTSTSPSSSRGKMVRTAPVKRDPPPLTKERINELVLASHKALPVEWSPEVVATIKSLTPAQLKQFTKPTDLELNTKRHWAVEYWNHLNTPVKHRDPTTKTYQTAARYFDELERGAFVRCKAGKRRKHLEGFCKAARLPYIVYSWRQDDIVTALKHLAINFQVKNLSKRIPRSLTGLLYNPYSKDEFFSYFLYSAFHYEEVKERVLKMKDDIPVEIGVLYLPKPRREDKRRMRAGNKPKRDLRELAIEMEQKEMGFSWLTEPKDLAGAAEKERTTSTSEE